MQYFFSLDAVSAGKTSDLYAEELLAGLASGEYTKKEARGALISGLTRNVQDYAMKWPRGSPAFEFVLRPLALNLGDLLRGKPTMLYSKYPIPGSDE